MFFASILTLIYVGLSLYVVRTRRANGISIGTGENETLLRATRAHSNFIEYTIITLLLMSMAEFEGSMVMRNLYIIGILLVISRVLHTYALVTKNGLFRTTSMVLTFTVLLWLAVRLLLASVGTLF